MSDDANKKLITNSAIKDYGVVCFILPFEKPNWFHSASIAKLKTNFSGNWIVVFFCNIQMQKCFEYSNENAFHQLYHSIMAFCLVGFFSLSFVPTNFNLYFSWCFERQVENRLAEHKFWFSKLCGNVTTIFGSEDRFFFSSYNSFPSDFFRVLQRILTKKRTKWIANVGFHREKNYN